MRIKELKKNLNLTCLRDGEFESLGYFTPRYKKMLVYIRDDTFIDWLDSRFVTCVVAPKAAAKKIPTKFGVIISSNPLETFLKIHCYLVKNKWYKQIEGKTIFSSAKIHPSAEIASDQIHIGGGSKIGPNAVIFPNTWIGDEVSIGAGTVIGADGFEYKKFGGKLLAMPHAGGVRIENQVEIKANCSIDKGFFGNFTVIGSQTKIDKAVQISHGAILGKRCLVTVAAIINGSTQIGNDVYIGPGAILSNSLTIGDNSKITMGAVVVRDVAKNEKVTGHFAVNHAKFLSYLVKNNLI